MPQPVDFSVIWRSPGSFTESQGQIFWAVGLDMWRCPKLIAKPEGQLWERWSCEGGRGILYTTATSLPVQLSPVLNSVIPQRAFYDPGAHVCWSFRQCNLWTFFKIKTPCVDFFEIPTWRNRSMTFPKIKVLFLKLFNKWRLGFHIVKVTVDIAMSQSNDKKNIGRLNISVPSEPSTEWAEVLMVQILKVRAIIR